MAGDYEMWHRLGQKYNVVLMPDGVVWYREHDAQEMNVYSKFLHVYKEIKLKYLHHEQCPLDKATVSEIIKRSNKNLSKQMMVALLKMNFKVAKEKFAAISK